jgi:adenylosuccinate lyase
MTERDFYSSPLAERYASGEMLALWSPHRRHATWRRIWLALARAEYELGADIPQAALSEMREHLDDIDFARVAEYERQTRHDVMAHVRAFGDVAPAARPYIHYGATSADITDNADLVLMRDGLRLLRGRLVRTMGALTRFAREWREEPTLGYTHLQPAQPTTVGKRATLWIEDLVLDFHELEYVDRSLPFRGIKGTTGTQASFLRLFDGDHDKVKKLDELVTRDMGFTKALPVTGQTYTRKLDAKVLGVLAGIAASAAKFSGDIRMLQAFGEIEEPFEREQVGSSAMAYKRNPMRSERIASLARFVLSLEPNANQTHSVQYFERTLDDSANRRLVIPEAFLATDAVLILMLNIVRGLQVHPARIRRRLEDEIPFMATEEIIVAAVKAGGDRQDAHEIIRKHSMEARAQVTNGQRNDLLDRLVADKASGVTKQMAAELGDPRRFIGRAPEQVDEFLANVVQPLLEGIDDETVQQEQEQDLRV